MSTSFFKGSLLATTAMAGVAISGPALAQEPVPAQNPTDVQGTAPPAPASDQTPAEGVQTSESAAPAEPTSAEEIVVTGTLIRNPNLVASAPVTVVGQEEMRLRQTNVAEEVLRTIPAAVPSIGSNVNNGANGFAYVNLRGLGSKRNIVLLDGVRITPADQSGRVDLNNIPLALVDRVDVLTGGASSTYGADAVTGVVNFITRSDFSGVEVSVSDQITQRGDGNYLRGDLTVGANFDDGRGNAVLSVGYQESDPVFFGGNERPGSVVAIESLQEECVPCQGSSTTAPAAFDVTGFSRRQVSPDGTTIVPFYHAYNFNPWNYFQTPFRRYNLYAAGHYDISDHITAYARGLFSNNRIVSVVAPSGVFGDTIRFNISNPFMTDAQANFFCLNAADADPATAGRQAPTAAQCTAARATTDPTSPNWLLATVGLRRRTEEIGPRQSDFQSQVFDFRAGLRGDITDNIGWDAWVSRGQSDQTQAASGYLLRSRVLQALVAVPGAGGAPVCINSAGGVVADCVPTNWWGTLGTITPEMATFLSGDSSIRKRTRLSQARATINGDAPFAMPWSEQPLGFAVGGEYRKYLAEQLPDNLAQQPGELSGFGGAIPPVSGGYDVYEGFAEVIAPLVTDRPFMNNLTLEAGIRRSHYTVDSTEAGNPKFNTTTWKIAGSWEPVADIKFRANYQHAVRAPNVAELFTPFTVGLTNLATDPCAGSITDPTLIAVCIAQGAPPAAIGNIQNPTAGQANVNSGGNVFLKPETANTWTVGAVVRPRFLSGFNATIDYYNIKVADAISAPTPQDMIQACFDNPSVVNPACLVIRRNAISGSLDGSPAEVPGLFQPFSNLGTLETSGIDATFNYRRNLGDILNAPAKLNISFSGNHLLHSKFQATPTSINRECAGFYSVNCDPPNPKWTFNERTTLSLGRVDLSLLWRYLSKTQIEDVVLEEQFAAADAANRDDAGNLLPEDEQGCPDFAGADPGGCVFDPKFRKIKAHHYFDFTTRFNVNEHFDLTFTVQNLFDKKPPALGNTIGTTTFNSGNTYPSTYDALGRRFGAAARIKF